MKEIKLKKANTILFLIVFSVIFSGFDVNAAENDLPFVVPNIKAPKFPNKDFIITKYGAIGDGQKKNAAAFAKAIEACSKAGGGKVVVPAGIWLTGPIQLKSNINLHLEEGALILFSENFEDYPIIRSTSGGIPEVRCMSPIFGENLNNIAITGTGIIDGSGQAWRPVKKSKLTESQWEKLLASGGVVDENNKIWYPSKEAMNGHNTVRRLDAKNADLQEYAAARQYLRPVMVSLVECKNILLDGPTFQNSPNWNIHPLLCENMIVQNITVRNPWFSQNGDGLDPESCKNLIIRNCRFDVGDDAICMKSGKDEYGRKRGKATENVAIENCIVYHGHGGFVIGSEMSGDVRNVYVRNCTFIGTDVGIRFKTTRGRGGIVENIYIQDIRMKDIPEDAILFTMYYTGNVFIPMNDEESDYGKNVPAASEETPRFEKIYMKNIICDGAKRAIHIQGLPEMAIRDISLENAVIAADNGVTCIEAENIKFKKCKIIPAASPTFKLFNSKNLVLEDVTVPDSIESFMRLAGNETEQIELRGFDKSIAGKIQSGKKVKPDAIIIK